MVSEKWTTRDEMDFIKRLDKEELAGYIQSCVNRVNWGEIKKDKVMRFAKSRLAMKGGD